jgi:hypothetical protein
MSAQRDIRAFARRSIVVTPPIVKSYGPQAGAAVRKPKLGGRLFPPRNTDATRVTISPEPRKTPEKIRALACAR